MNTLEFLQRILPTTGYYACLAVARGGHPIQGLHSTIQQLADTCLKLDLKGVDTYYGISAFQDTSSRKQENVRAIKVIPVDVDCGPNKPYATQLEGAKALLEFSRTYMLPAPMVIGSGGGIHGYWVLDQETDYAAWKEVALALKAAAAQQLFHIDTGKTGDAACVLRPVGTNNYKLSYSRPVLLLSQGVICSLDSLRKALAAFVVSKHSHTSATSPLLAALEVKPDYPPAEAGLIVLNCAQIADVSNKRGNVEEPLWYTTLGVAAYCENPESVAIAWSNGHPDYTEIHTLRKMEQWRSTVSGPPSCQRFKEFNPTGCKDCKFDGKVTTPLRLGVRHKETVISASAPDEEARMVALPKPFKRTATGIKVVVDEVEIDVCPFDLYPLGQGKDEHLGYEVARYKWDRPHMGWTLLELPVRDLAEGARDFGAHLGNSGIVPANKYQSGYMSLMLRNFMAELNKTKPASNLYSSMGWKEDFSEFVLGGTIYKNTGAKEPIGLSKNAPKHILNAYSQAGSLDDWVKFTHVLDNPNLAYYRFVLGTAFGSPLWTFGGLGGVVISLFGETGAGKTTIQNWVQSVYGNPQELLIPAVATQNATFSRLGVYNNLPATIDEMSVLPAKDTASFIYWASMGKDKPRLNADAVERDARKFSTMIIGSTNMSLNAKLVSVNAENSALLMRLLELTIPRHPFFAENSASGRKIHSFLHSNYGTAGPVYIQHLLALGADKLRAMVNESLVDFRVKYQVKFSGEERFWEHAIVLSDLGNSIAKSIGLIDYDYEKGTEWVLQQVDPLRKGVKEQVLDCFDIVGRFLNEHMGHSLVVLHTGNNVPHYDQTRVPRDEILIRYNLFRKTPSDVYSTGVVYLDRTFFFRWLTANGHDPKNLRMQLYDAGVINQPHSDRYYMGRDTGVKTGQIYVIGINLNNPRLAGVLNDVEANAGLGELKQVIK